MEPANRAGDVRRRLTVGRVAFLVSLALGICVTAFAVAVPNFNSPPRRWANEAAAIATLKVLGAAQAQCQAAGVYDVDGDGVGEYGYFAELAGSDGRLAPPVLSPAFLRVAPLAGAPGGVVTRSGYHFALFLPGKDGPGIAEAPRGGRGENAPDPDRAEREWFCFAWPVEPGTTGRRMFFVGQEGEVRARPWQQHELVPGPTRMAQRPDLGEWAIVE